MTIQQQTMTEEDYIAFQERFMQPDGTMVFLPDQSSWTFSGVFLMGLGLFIVPRALDAYSTQCMEGEGDGLVLGVMAFFSIVIYVAAIVFMYTSLTNFGTLVITPDGMIIKQGFSFERVILWAEVSALYLKPSPKVGGFFLMFKTPEGIERAVAPVDYTSTFNGVTIAQYLNMYIQKRSK